MSRRELRRRRKREEESKGLYEGADSAADRRAVRRWFSEVLYVLHHLFGMPREVVQLIVHEYCRSCEPPTLITNDECEWWHKSGKSALRRLWQQYESTYFREKATSIRLSLFIERGATPHFVRAILLYDPFPTSTITVQIDGRELTRLRFELTLYYSEPKNNSHVSNVVEGLSKPIIFSVLWINYEVKKFYVQKMITETAFVIAFL